MSAKAEAGTVGILRAWDRAEDGGGDTEHGRVLWALTMALEAEGLAQSGKLTDRAREMIKRVEAREKRAKKTGGKA